MKQNRSLLNEIKEMRLLSPSRASPSPLHSAMESSSPSSFSKAARRATGAKHTSKKKSRLKSEESTLLGENYNNMTEIVLLDEGYGSPRESFVIPKSPSKASSEVPEQAKPREYVLKDAETQTVKTKHRHSKLHTQRGSRLSLAAIREEDEAP